MEFLPASLLHCPEASITHPVDKGSEHSHRDVPSEGYKEVRSAFLAEADTKGVSLS